MKQKLAVLLIILFYQLLFSQSTDRPNPKLKHVAGIGILCAQYVSIPLIDYFINWKDPPGITNPFTNIRENETFHQDEMWHFIAAGSTTRLNYYLLRDFIGLSDPIWINAISNGIFWTSMEVLDGAIGSGFSIRDELGNLLGIAFSSLKLKYPSIPFSVRLGMADWRKFGSSFSNGFRSINKNKYSFMKVDFLYTSPYYLYGGLSLSTDLNSRTDRVGLTAGLDILKALNDWKKGWWNWPVDYMLESLNISVNFTVWID